MKEPIRWRKKVQQPDKRFDTVSIPFLLSIVLSFLVMVSYALLSFVVVGDKKDLFQNRLWTVANYLRVYDKDTANAVRDIDTIIKAYTNKENVFATQKEAINRVRAQIVTQTESLLRNNEQFSRLAYFIEDTYPYKDELMLYMGENIPKSYLVILQNSSERRPNGGFFGSFAYVRVLQWRIRTIHMIDSYLGYKTMPRITITPPSRSDPIYQGVPFGWIASNKFGFTNIDGDYMIQLYNKTFNNPESDAHIPPEVCKDICHRPIDGVVFVQTNSLKSLIPDLEKKARERQFMNASVDILRGENLPNKKEYYLSDSQDFFISQTNTVLKNFINNFESITDTYSFGIYIPSISQGLNEVLTKYHFTTIPNPHTIYAWDTNKSFNKIDEFVTKDIIIRDTIGDIILEQTNNDQIDIKNLRTGNYTMEIKYKINVPRYYKDYIKQLEKKTDIELTQRELGILALSPTIAEDGVQRFWESKSQLYYPNNITITQVRGIEKYIPFVSPFGKGIDYIVLTQDNNKTTQLFIDFTITP